MLEPFYFSREISKGHVLFIVVFNLAETLPSYERLSEYKDFVSCD